MIPDAGQVEVLVTVKAAPQPSQTYGDTVCVAGVLVPPLGDAAPELIRLYPVPYRYLVEGEGFKKYDLRRFTINRNPKDSRAESRRVDLSGATTLVEHIDRWRRRALIIERVEKVTMCSLLHGVRVDPNGPSLGLVEIRTVKRLEVRPTPPPSPDAVRLREAQEAQQQLHLFGESAQTVRKALRPPPFEAKLHYDCFDPGCKGHRQGILDWELAALQFRAERLGRSKEETEAWIQKKFFEEPFRPGTRPAVYVGNQANPQRRGTFSILGMYYPLVADLPPSTMLL